MLKNSMKLTDFAAEIERQENAKRDFVADTRSITVNIDPPMPVVVSGQGANQRIERRRPAVTLEMKGLDETFTVSQRALRQLTSKSRIPAAYFDRMVESGNPELVDLAKESINRWLQHDDASRLLRTMDGQARAFLSNRYRMLDNHDLVQAVIPVLKESGHEFSIASVNVSDARMYMKVLFPKMEGEVKEGDVVQNGLSISNSETGNGRLRIQPFSLRLVCLNGMVRSENAGMARNHVGRALSDGGDPYELFSDETLRKDDEAFWSKIQDVVRASMDPTIFERELEVMRGAADIRLDSPIKVVEEVTKRYKLGDEAEGKLLGLLTDSGAPGQALAGQTVWGMANALTLYAQSLDNYDNATEFEALGGKLISDTALIEAIAA